MSNTEIKDWSQLSEVEKLEDHWFWNLQPKFNSFKDLCIIFPEAKEFLMKDYRAAKKSLKRIKVIEEKCKRIVYKHNSKHQDFWLAVVEHAIIRPLKFIENNPGLTNSPYKPHQSNIEDIVKWGGLFLKSKPDDPKLKQVLDVERARAYPLDSLIDFKHRLAVCIFHNDRNPSLYYYPKTNTCYCFSCNTSADSIKVAQTLFNLNFVEAVKKLTN